MGIGLKPLVVKDLLRYSSRPIPCDKPVAKKFAEEILVYPYRGRRRIETNVEFADGKIERLDKVLRSQRNLKYNGKLWVWDRHGWNPEPLIE